MRIPTLLAYLLLTALACASPAGLHAQEVLTGTWQGKLYQDREPEATTFTVRLELTQKGSRVTGTTYIHVTDEPQWRAQMALQGSMHGAVFTFEETRILFKRNPFDWDWCIKSGRMLLKRSGNYWRIEGTMDGTLNGSPCVTADAMLERLEPVRDKKAPTTAPVVAKPASPQPLPQTEEPPTPQPKPEPSAPTVAKPESPTPQPDYGALLGRKITHQRDITVHKTQLELQVWDSDKEDGDIISLSFNGQWLLRNHPVTKTRKTVTVNIEKGKANQLILYAENEGTMPPNTAAISFHDGQADRNLNLSSSKSTCGALRFIVK